MGLTAGVVPPRVDAPVKAGLLELVAHAHREAGWSARRSAGVLGVEHTRLLRWAARAAADRLVDARPGPEVAVHALLDWERAAIVSLAEDWGEIDRSHRKLAHRGSRLGLVHASESTVWRVLVAAGVVLPAAPAREPRPKTPWPDWAELVPGVIYIYDFQCRRRHWKSYADHRTMPTGGVLAQVMSVAEVRKVGIVAGS